MRFTTEDTEDTENKNLDKSLKLVALLEMSRTSVRGNF